MFGFKNSEKFDWSFRETNEQKIISLSRQVKDLKSGYKVFKLEEQIDDDKRSMERLDIVSIQRTTAYEEDINVLNNKHLQVMSDLKEENYVFVAKIEAESKLNLTQAKAEQQAAKTELIDELREASQKHVDELKEKMATAIAESRVKSELVGKQEDHIKSLVRILEQKLPKVELTKLKINVEVPTTVVTSKSK